MASWHSRLNSQIPPQKWPLKWRVYIYMCVSVWQHRASLQWMLCHAVFKVVYISMRALTSKGRNRGPKGRERGCGSWEGPASPSHQLWGSEDCCKLRRGFCVFLGFKNYQFLSTTHKSPVILTANFSHFAFALGVSIFDQVGHKSQQGAKASASGAEPPPLATRYFNH